MLKLAQDIRDSSDWIARELRSSNYRATFTPQSLWDIDLFLMTMAKTARPNPAACFPSRWATGCSLWVPMSARSSAATGAASG